MATTTNFGWETPDDTDLVKDGALAIRTLGSAIDTSMVDLKGGTTGQVLSKASNTDMDFTWVAQDDSNAIQNAIVDAKGDLIAASAADTPARLAVGSNGETLVADSSATTGLRWQGNYAAGKNAIINGDFRIWQRGTSFAGSSSLTYSADRFVTNYDATPTSATLSQQTFTPGTAPVAGYEGQFFHRNTVTTRGSANYYIMSQRIEDVRTFAGQTITFSFWAKLNSGSVTASRFRFGQNFGSGGSADVLYDSGYSVSLTSSWQRFTRTITLNSVSGKTIGTGSFLFIDFIVDFTGANAVDVWGWQLESGSVATAFQTATGTLAGELAACQRYYYRYTGGPAFFAIGSFSGTTANNAEGCVKLPVTMRTAPTGISVSGTYLLAGTSINPTITIDTNTSTRDNLGLVLTSTANFAQYRSYLLLSNNGANNYIEVTGTEL